MINAFDNLLNIAEIILYAIVFKDHKNQETYLNDCSKEIVSCIKSFFNFVHTMSLKIITLNKRTPDYFI